IPFLHLSAQGYKIVNRFPVEGDGGWDYLSVDEATGRIFVSHGNVVNVVSESNGKLLATIPSTKGVHGVAIAADLNKAFISDGAESAITVIDLKTLEFLDKVNSSGENPDAILYDPFSRKVFAFNGRTANATVIDAETNKIVATIPLDGKPEFAVTDSNGRVYVNIEDKSEIACIGSASLKVEKVWSIDPGEEPTGLALDNENHRLFSVCSNKLMVILNAETGKVISTVPIGEGCDGTAFDPGLKRVYSSNGEGTVTVVSEVTPDQYKVVETIKTQRGARTITIDKRTHHLFLSAAEYNADKEGSRPPVKPGSFILLDIAPSGR
ncbi:MAG TPA: YncE family protein, partial [Bacteroidales bacterium]|nr:YncE family protein [Bacteroidales bacterium]